MNNDDPMVENFFNYARKRECVRVLKEAGVAKPWTKDPIIQEYKFCNVFREDDTVTRWIHTNVRIPFAKSPILPALLALCRWVNQIDTLSEIFDTKLVEWTWDQQFQYGLHRVQNIIRARMAAGLPTWTGAYMIRAESSPDKEWFNWSKERYICEIVVRPVWLACHEKPGQIKQSIQSATELFASMYGWGKFMAYEVVTDLTHCPAWLSNAPDLKTWANAGPGAVRGLNRIHGRELTAKPKESQTLAEMQELLPMFQDVFPARDVVLRDVEHTLCEFDKYERVLLGQGRPRSKYNGRG